MPFTPLKPNFTPLNSPAPQPTQGTGLGGFAEGFGKGILGTFKGLSQIGTKIGNAVLPKSLEFPDIYSEKSLQENASKGGFRGKLLGAENLKPQNTSQSLGYGAEKFAEFLLPASKAAKAEKYFDILSAGMKPLAGALTRIGGKAAVQGLSAGGVRLAQTGGDIKDAAKTAATAGVVRGGLATVGETIRAIKLPERLYSVIFKNSKKEMLSELKSEGISNLRKTNPQKYKQLTDEGIIKTGIGGKPYLNDTLAEQALNRGLRGSDRAMANIVVEKTFDTESKLQKIVSASKHTVNISEPQYIKVLKSIEAEYDEVGFGEISKKAAELAKRLEASNPQKVSAETALELRRFLDRMRFAASFDRPASKLSMTQSNFKTLSDALRERINKVPGVGNAMKDYTFYIDALEAIASDAGKKGNAQLLQMIDSIMLGGGFASGNPLIGGVGIVGRHMLKSAPLLTGLGQGLKNPAISPLQSALLGSGSAGVQSKPEPQQ